MVKTITLTGNAETVGYAIDSVKDKNIRYEIKGNADSFRFTDYEVKSIRLLQSEKNPYHLIGKIEVKGAVIDIILLSALVSKMYATLKVKG